MMTTATMITRLIPVETANAFSRTRSVISRHATSRVASRPLTPRPPRGRGRSASALEREVGDAAGAAGGVEHRVGRGAVGQRHERAARAALHDLGARDADQP